MANSETFENIKIPYPSEGVIRTAAIDDTLTPENSVQIGVNINFDRIGAIQTRKGLSQYASQLTGMINNFGSLNNKLAGNGYESIIKSGPTATFTSSEAKHMDIAKVDDTHFIVFWSGVDDDGFVQVIRLNAATGIITALGTPLEFDASGNEYNSCFQVDSNHFINFWQGGASQHGYAQVFTVNLGTFAVSANGSPLEIDATFNAFNSCGKVDASHFINFWNALTIGKSQVFAVNLGTYAVTAVGSPFTYEATATAFHNSCGEVDTGHFINFWMSDSSDGKTQVFNVNMGTFAVTALSSALTFESGSIEYNSCQRVDATHFINFWSNGDGVAQVFEIDSGTYAVTTAGALFTFEIGSNSYNSSVSVGDGEHFANFWSGTGNVDYAQLFEVNTMTFDIIDLASPVTLGISNSAPYNAAVLASSYKVVNVWRSSSDTGYAGVFNLQGDVVSYDLLYAQEADGDVKSLSGGVWTTRRSGIHNTQKARFTQFLNYIWMVNGNASIGDPVATSNGGAFGTDLVPLQLPPGDFIQAGFEGRVWIVDKLYDIVYFTDIVQFTPPNTYTLTYDPETNFIKNFSPQNGQTITGLVTTPRALLLFKEDSIYRIYGATSVDAYPAYNVGTYSHESIIQTKDGLYFHHSSGFYKFAYDSQPVEISRRIIDFVQAIPRSNYGEIKGVYDGFDAVEWAVGAVTVEGVTYTNCVLRYTISTQIWTIYDYPSNYVTAFIYFDDGTNLNMIMGTDVGKVLKMDDGYTDLGQSIYFEVIDRWRSFTEMYAKIKSINGFNVYTENAGGVKFQYQGQDAGPNQWEEIGSITEVKNTLFPTDETEDFNVIRLRLTGNSKGTQIVFHGIELLKVDDKGFSQN